MAATPLSFIDYIDILSLFTFKCLEIEVLNLEAHEALADFKRFLAAGRISDRTGLVKSSFFEE